MRNGHAAFGGWMKFENKVALVTGASKGIGRAIALAFAREGARVAVTARSHGALEALAGEIGEMGREALPITADLGIEEEVARIVPETLERFGRIDILVNNAGLIHASANLVDFDPALWRTVIDVNLIAPALLIKAVLPPMIASGGGTIINISSIGGRRGGAGRSAYRASKAALISLTESVAAEARPHGINAVCICPGGVDTEGVRAAFYAHGRALNPNLMRPEEIADVALFLASDAASAITGTAVDAFGATNPLFRAG